jgi:hypothetical protein
MSYDILLRRQISKSFARDDASDGRLGSRGVSLKRVMLPLAIGLATAAVAAASLFALPKKARRATERTYYRATRRVLRPTQVTPAVTMRELVYGPEDDA